MLSSVHKKHEWHQRIEDKNEHEQIDYIQIFVLSAIFRDRILKDELMYIRKEYKQNYPFNPLD